MRVVLDALHVVPGATGGTEVYARALAASLAPLVDLVVVTAREGADDGWPVPPLVLPVRARSRTALVAAQQALLPRAAARAGADVLHSLANTAPLTGSVPRVVTVHDLHHRTHPEAHGRTAAAVLRRLVPAGARRAARVVAVSPATRDELLALLHLPADRVDVVEHGPGRPQGPATDPADVRRRLGLGAVPLLVAPGVRRGHKNAEGLLAALARLPTATRPLLVVPGYPTPQDAAVEATAAALGVAVRLTPWLPDADLEGLLRAATAVVLPSRAEGFGLPVVEALARGVPVVATDLPVLRHLAGDAALLVDTADPAALADALRRVLTDEPLRARLAAAGPARVAGLSWERAARETVEVYRRATSA